VSRKALLIQEEPGWITDDALFAIHAAQIERFGGLHGILDKNVVHSALTRAINRWAYDETCDMADLAAAYLVGFAGSQGFNDGNKRTGVACALVFLAINGISIDPIDPQLLQDLALEVANGRAGLDETSHFFRSQLAGH
jgi:death-on-curing protein